VCHYDSYFACPISFVVFCSVDRASDFCGKSEDVPSPQPLSPHFKTSHPRFPLTFQFLNLFVELHSEASNTCKNCTAVHAPQLSTSLPSSHPIATASAISAQSHPTKTKQKVPAWREARCSGRQSSPRMRKQPWPLQFSDPSHRNSQFAVSAIASLLLTPEAHSARLHPSATSTLQTRTASTW
jgi:hypothetical protein